MVPFIINTEDGAMSDRYLQSFDYKAISMQDLKLAAA